MPYTGRTGTPPADSFLCRYFRCSKDGGTSVNGWHVCHWSFQIPPVEMCWWQGSARRGVTRYLRPGSLLGEEWSQWHSCTLDFSSIFGPVQTASWLRTEDTYRPAISKLDISAAEKSFPGTNDTFQSAGSASEDPDNSPQGYLL